MTPTNRDIKYINRDFSEFRARLIEYAQTYFPNTYNDFSPTSPGMMFMEQAAYVGDVLSFYLDNQFQETFIQYAQQTNNVFELAYMFGYKPKTTGVAQTNITFTNKSHPKCQVQNMFLITIMLLLLMKIQLFLQLMAHHF